MCHAEDDEFTDLLVSGHMPTAKAAGIFIVCLGFSPILVEMEMYRVILFNVQTNVF